MGNVLGYNVNVRQAIGKVKQRSQMGEVYTDDGRIIDVELPVLLGCASQDDWGAAFLIDGDNQFQDAKSKQWYQQWGERCTVPICSIATSKIKDLTDLINDLHHCAWVRDLANMAREQAKDRARSWLMVLLGVPIILAALVLGIKVIGGNSESASTGLMYMAAKTTAAGISPMLVVAGMALLAAVPLFFFWRHSKSGKVSKGNLYSEGFEEEAEPSVAPAKHDPLAKWRNAEANTTAPMTKEQVNRNSNHPNALIHDVAHRMRYLAAVTLKRGTEYGRQWHYYSNLVFSLVLQNDGTLGMMVPKEDLDHPPGELYEAIHNEEDMKEIFGRRGKASDKAKWGLLILAACVALFLMFLATQNH